MINVSAHVYFSHFRTSGRIKTDGLTLTTESAQAGLRTHSRNCHFVISCQCYSAVSIPNLAKHRWQVKEPKTSHLKEARVSDQWGGKKAILHCDTFRHSSKPHSNTPVPILVKMVYFNAAR